MKIVVTNNQDMTVQQTKRLDSLGDVVYYNSLPASAEEFLKRVEGADIICSGTAGLKDAYTNLKNVYVTVAFVSTAFVDAKLMRRNGVLLSNAPGVNRHAVAEWIIAMMLLLSRNLLDAIGRTESYRKNGALPPVHPGLAGCNLTILGKGNVGTRVAEVASSLGMHVSFYSHEDDLHTAVTNADAVVDALSENPTSHKLLNDDFFAAMKPGSIFVTVSRSAVLDEDALLHHINNGHLAGAASDCGGILVGDTDDPLYNKLLHHPRILVTPHIAYSTEMSVRIGVDVMIDNVEAYINGSPQNLVN